MRRYYAFTLKGGDICFALKAFLNRSNDKEALLKGGKKNSKVQNLNKEEDVDVVNEANDDLDGGNEGAASDER